MAETKKIPERSEVPEQYKWALHDIFPTDEAWQACYDETRELVARIPTYQGRLGESAQTLYEYLSLDQTVGERLSNLANYSMRKQDEDTRVATYQAMVGKLMSLYVEASGAGAFETPELLKIPAETLEQFCQEQPELAVYRRYFDRIQRRKPHILSDAEEKLLAAAGELTQAPDDIYSKMSNADLKFRDARDSAGTPHPVSNGSYGICMESEDRTLRKNAFASMYATYGGMQNTIAATLSAQVKSLQFYAAARHYDSTLEASLDSSEVPVSVYHNLIDVVNQNLDKLHRYVRLRKKLLGVDELHMYDLYTPIVAGVNREIPYEEAKKTVLAALAPLGADYLAIMQEGFDNRWIDVYENVGKCSGGYMCGALVHPFVLLNYKDNLDSVFTIAHEMGHAAHSYLSNSRQPAVYRNYEIFVAEVASTCNEALLMEYLLGQTTDRKERAWLLNHQLEQFKGTLYRQTMFAEFELRINELNAQGEVLTAELLSQEYLALNKKYYGPDVVSDDEIALEWSRIPHFYYDYYVYQYATGYSAAIALSRRILDEGEPAVKDYFGFLSGGCSADPITLLRGAGVDMASPQPVQAALDLFDRLLDEMEELTA